MPFLFPFFQILIPKNFDIDLLRKINLNRNTNLDGTMKLISKTDGIIGVGMPVSVLLASYIEKDERLLEIGVNMTLALVANTVNTQVMKQIYNRKRPANTYPDIEAFDSDRRLSFPSGHASIAFCTATSLTLNFPKWYVAIPSYAWASTVAYSRLHMGMHYPSDVLVGALLGAGSAYVTFKANQYIKRYYYTKQIINMF
ncbi:MAG: phosphoesterase PA-phosphatase-like protein [Bacteroidetes bacterium OLB11]|nr:MAG: phosphoesterase PA-phosphatase-like protein [Bacteroidetes bacterium OLB11]